jgi:hypothetical protein
MMAENMIIIAPIPNINSMIEDDMDNSEKIMKELNLKQPIPRNQQIFQQSNPVERSPFYLRHLRKSKILPLKLLSGEF